MNKFLLSNIKEIMIYIRNNTMDEDLSKIVLELKKSIINHNFETLLGMIKTKVPQSAEVSNASGSLIFIEDKKHLHIEQFICEILDILLKAIDNREFDLIYDLSDMLQGIPDVEYWSKAKNMRNYWKHYVEPIKRKWKLNELGNYNPK